VNTLNPIRVFAASACATVLVLAAAVVHAQVAKEPAGVVVMTGAPIGGVKFGHKLHAKDRGIKCETCHHASKPEKPMKTAQEKCQDCHTKIAAAPMKTKTQAAFHDPMAKSGLCIDCHVESNAKGKKAPTKCTECHKKA
jgi:class III cytochrome C family protein